MHIIKLLLGVVWSILTSKTGSWGPNPAIASNGDMHVLLALGVTNVP